MGPCFSSNQPQTVSNKIEQELSKANKARREVIKLLLLGTGDSGKTTVFKQMRILYGSGYDEESRIGLRKAAHANIIAGAKECVAATRNPDVGKALTDKDSIAAADLISGLDEQVDPLNEKIARAIALLWEDENFQATWANRSNFQVLDGWGDFAAKAKDYPEWGGPEWIPSVDDALRVRVRTSGIVEEIFDIDGSKFKLVDVGGQRNERRKWINAFNEVTAVLFVIATSEYDQVLFEDKKTNRLVEALNLFDEVANSETFQDTTFILFLNKHDIFLEKFIERQIPLNISGSFPDAPTKFDDELAMEWMRQRFLDLNRVGDKLIFSHVTTALDTNNMQRVLDAVKSTILNNILKDLDLMG